MGEGGSFNDDNSSMLMGGVVAGSGGGGVMTRSVAWWLVMWGGLGIRLVVGGRDLDGSYHSDSSSMVIGGWAWVCGDIVVVTTRVVSQSSGVSEGSGLGGWDDGVGVVVVTTIELAW
ncbi:hypothetical protein L6452_36309 [Arctium lappa]|uniref:Uncharacterized protein n=1 Tax=Arctium lappa TaxID=4217 RepID=A0ACB8Y8T7_ARCLA|nr:hypothetical protein L6452_36309 [Arctium lappa]